MQLPANATLEHAAALAAELPQALAQADQDHGGAPATWRIDASALQNFDTATIALLMQARRLAQAAGRDFEVTGAPPKLSQLARLYGVEDLLELQAAPVPENPHDSAKPAVSTAPGAAEIGAA